MLISGSINIGDILSYDIHAKTLGSHAGGRYIKGLE
jgi:hypothetical protein